jgi:hypothetical protein
MSAALGIHGAARSRSDSGFVVDLDTGCYHYLLRRAPLKR